MQGRQDQTSIERKQEAVQNFAATSGGGVRMSREEVTSLVNTIIKVCSNLAFSLHFPVYYFLGMQARQTDQRMNSGAHCPASSKQKLCEC